ncbi:subtilisin-like serine protease [Halalkalibacter wakoensis JCM 9140]|uniref:Subtilisin-like serine protease n=1 Tax=Halalkalibacter wakoensis JCM 9140 TaxID=1236970 RepID=W4Q5X2_9BACI|nr:S-layer homology domain-containing protein [Halalkalibacter wakoensis]GAE27456.1 subtilisin-like serine protease [Halalkalibacter wakoensis JCM 9140]
MGKKAIGVSLLVFTLLCFVFPGATAAENGTIAERKALLSELAIQYDVPPEIVLAIAYQETQMRQFDENGDPILNADGDGGIGIMQVTMSPSELEQKGIDEQRLKDDIAYNIEVGIMQLLEKKAWEGRLLPSFQQVTSPAILEGWYFPVLAYNGLEQRNDPNRSNRTYQDQIFATIESRALLRTNPPSSFEVTYNEGGNIMRFLEEQRNLSILKKQRTESRQMFQEGEIVFTFHPEHEAMNLRSEPNTSSSFEKVTHAHPFTVVSGPYYDNNLNNLFAFYEIKSLDGTQTGYLASSYLHPGEISIFPDIQVTNTEMRSAVAMLEARGSLSGYPDGTFGTNIPLQRRHAAKILVEELELSLPAGFESKATDHEDNTYMLIAEAHGILTPYSDGTIRPRDSFRRSQMALVLTRLFGEDFTEPTREVSFTDIDSSFSGFEAINRLAYNGITKVEGDAFRPNESVRRGQFAVFLARVDERVANNE